MTDSDEVLQLRACRADLDRIKTELDAVRQQQAQLEQKADELIAERREARKKRKAAVLAADAAKVPRLWISKEVGMPRGNVYKLLEGGADDEGTAEDDS
jgi:hypothetical protein